MSRSQATSLPLHYSTQSARKLFDIDPSDIFARSTVNEHENKNDYTGACVPLERKRRKFVPLSYNSSWFCFRFEFLERMSQRAKDTHIHGDWWNIRKHAYAVAYLLADTFKETRNALGSVDQIANFFQEIDHHRLIMLLTGVVRDG